MNKLKQKEQNNNQKKKKTRITSGYPGTRSFGIHASRRYVVIFLKATTAILEDALYEV